MHRNVNYRVSAECKAGGNYDAGSPVLRRTRCDLLGRLGFRLPRASGYGARFQVSADEIAPPGATPAPPGKPHVDYDMIFVDQSDPNKIFGNWRNDAPSACRDKAVAQYPATQPDDGLHI